ncbi:dolichyl-phosphate-mannose--protein mannosyltransferase [Solicola gregarius]|uniref:Polyprenol-phosphate-mannose--protein mannosyltransferase n=1 Tax=Solicola gregarius TaxID=2908642 RepID=A0AA46YMG2_9ACTN|nr:phospholipid carrier-dependent glycosyltransferase [Solicola gregarius]UYM06599.1 phospholipid carrier-dependent glycosyltransferase [Solicola gregarius]
MTVDSEAARTNVSSPVTRLGRDRFGALLPAISQRLTPIRRRSTLDHPWLWPSLVALLALAIRVWRISEPKHITFDETYYAKDAYSLLKYGYVRDFTDNADTRINDGRFDGIFKDVPSEIVHPDGGKWIIATGEHLFGMTPFGWRVAAAVVGALTVLVLARLVIRLTGSVPLGCVAGLLLCFDGLHFVMSRIALLDVLLAFWIVCGVACLVADRDWGRARLARTHVTSPIEGFGPVRALLFRPWRITAGVCLGMACGTKWSAIYVVAAFGLLAYAWDVGARRGIGVRAAWIKSALVDGLPAFVSIVGVAVVVYLATWTGWLIHHDAYEAQFGHGFNDNPAWGSYVDEEPSGFVGEASQAFRSLWHYHQLVYSFHTGDYLAGKTHPYQSNPQGWLLLNRPVSMATQTDLPAGAGGCTESGCVRQVLGLGNPVIWWVGVAALIGAAWQWIVRRDWRFGIPVLGVATTWLPWFQYDDRPIFSFYTVAILPFTIIAITLVMGVVFGGPRASPARRRWGAVAIGTYVALAVAAFAYFYPILAYQIISLDHWNQLIWFNRWI